MRIPVLLFVFVLACGFAGCVSSGKRIQPDQISMLQKGKTTRIEVEKVMGPPDMVSLLSEGQRVLIYQYVEARPKAASFIPIIGPLVGGVDSRHQILQVVVDKNDVVQDYAFTDANKETVMGVGAGR